MSSVIIYYIDNREADVTFASRPSKLQRYVLILTKPLEKKSLDHTLACIYIHKIIFRKEYWFDDELLTRDTFRERERESL